MKYTVSIKENYIFKKTLKIGNYSKGRTLVVYAIQIKSDNNFIGVCVNKKNGNSVIRNKFKRWVREVYKNEEIFLKKGYAIVFLYKKYVDKNVVTYDLVKKDIVNSLSELNIYEK